MPILLLLAAAAAIAFWMVAVCLPHLIKIVSFFVQWEMAVNSVTVYRGGHTLDSSYVTFNVECSVCVCVLGLVPNISISLLFTPPTHLQWAISKSYIFVFFFLFISLSAEFFSLSCRWNTMQTAKACHFSMALLFALFVCVLRRLFYFNWPASVHTPHRTAHKQAWEQKRLFSARPKANLITRKWRRDLPLFARVFFLCWLTAGIAWLALLRMMCMRKRKWLIFRLDLHNSVVVFYLTVVSRCFVLCFLPCCCCAASRRKYMLCFYCRCRRCCWWWRNRKCHLPALNAMSNGNDSLDGAHTHTDWS